MGIRLHCEATRAPDGSYEIRPVATSCYVPSPFLLTRSAARLWEVVAAIATLPPEGQEVVLGDLDPRLRPHVVAALAKLERAGAIEVTGQAVPGLALPLATLHLEITHRCNFSCRACYLGAALAPARAARDEGTIAEWTTVIDDAARLGCTHAVVTGGEPFVRRDVLEILRALARRRIGIEINTNASCITDEIADAIFEIGVQGVEVTLYGYDRASTAGYTRVVGSFEGTVRGVRRLAARGVPVQVKYFATAATAGGIDVARATIEALGVPLVGKGHAIHADVFSGVAPPEELRPDLAVPEMLQEAALPCSPGSDGLVIGPQGGARPCPKLAIPLGNVFDEGLAAVWERSPAVKAFRAFWPRWCADEGYRQGARIASRCPAARLLSRPTGLGELEARWREVRPELG